MSKLRDEVILKIIREQGWPYGVEAAQGAVLAQGIVVALRVVVAHGSSGGSWEEWLVEVVGAYRSSGGSREQWELNEEWLLIRSDT